MEDTKEEEVNEMGKEKQYEEELARKGKIFIKKLEDMITVNDEPKRKRKFPYKNIR